MNVDKNVSPLSRPSSVTMTRLRDHLAASTTTGLILTASACVLARGRHDGKMTLSLSFKLQGIEATPSRVGGGLHLHCAGQNVPEPAWPACCEHMEVMLPG